MVGKKVLLSNTPLCPPSACLRYGFGAQRETISSFFHGTMSMERRNSPFEGGKGDVSTITDDDLK